MSIDKTCNCHLNQSIYHFVNMTATSGFQKEIPQFDSVRAGSDWMSGCGLSKVVLSHPLHFIGKGSAEHQSLSLGLLGHIGLVSCSNRFT